MVLSNGTNLVIVGGIIAFFLTIITMSIIILRRRFLTKTIRIGFISKGGHIERIRLKRSEIGETINHNKGKYEYEPKAEMTTYWGKEIYYSKETTKPIFFTAKGEIDEKSNISPENLKAIIETELIAKLFKKEVFNTENILIMICLVLGVVSVILLASIKFSGVKISDSPENIVLLKDIMLNALKGI